MYHPNILLDPYCYRRPNKTMHIHGQPTEIFNVET